MSIQEAYINVRKGSVLHFAMFFLVLVGVVFLYATIKDLDAFANEEVQTVHLFPSTVSSEAWVNTNALFIQDANEDAVFANFNPGNSAFITKVSETSEIDEPPIESEEDVATSTEEVEIVEKISTTTEETSDDTSSSTEEVVDETASTSEDDLIEESEEEPSLGETIIDAIIDLFDGDEGTTTDQEATVIEALPQEEGIEDPVQEVILEVEPVDTEELPDETSTTTPESTATSTVSSVWGVIKNLFTTLAVAQVGTSTEETEETPAPEVLEEPEEAVDESSTTTEEVIEEEVVEKASTTTEEVIEEELGTTTEEVVEEEEKVETPVEIELPEDTTPPEIFINGNNPAFLNVGDSYNDLGAIIPEVRDSNLGISIKVNGVEMRSVSIDTSTSSTFIIEYSATDISGNTGYAERIVYVGDVEEIETEEGVEEASEFSFLDSFCKDGNSACSKGVIEFSDFGVAEVLEDQDIRNVQLRFSLGAIPHVDSLPNEEGIVVQYYYRGEWRNSGTLAFNEEISNATNGGYFLYALPIYEDWSELQDIKIRIVHESNSGEIGEAYLESLWLEVETGSRVPLSELDLLSLLKLDEELEEEAVSDDELLLPDGTLLKFENTDENEGETLIIKTNEVVYEGLTRTTTYFSVTNTAFSSDTFTLQTYFPQGVGEVISIEEWNQNKQKTTVLPEYQSVVYQCAGEWVAVEDVVEVSGTEEKASSTPAFENGYSQKLQELANEVASEGEEGLPQYICEDTSSVRECSAFSDGGVGCEVHNVKVNTYKTAKAEGGWEETRLVEEIVEEVEEGGFLNRVQDFLGLNGPETKPVPDSFELTERSLDTYMIEPGETKFFKMDISFPPNSYGEYWIEAIGEKRLYGLLDPFWSSSWPFKLPITLDNATSTDTLTEHQVLLQIPSSLTDFWTNVNDDGSDIRFLRETAGNDDGNWYDTSWSYRTAVTIQSSEIQATLTDFPVYVDLADLGTTFFNNVQSDGDDIRVTESDGFTEVPREVVAINTGAETGELHFRATSLSSTVDTTFYIYHGNTGALGYSSSTTYGSQNVWTNGFEAVYHLQEDPGGTAPQFIDSTGNNHDADSDNMALANQVAGEIEFGVDANGTDESIIAPGFTGLGTSNQAYSMGIWFNADSGETDGNIIGMSVQNPPGAWRLPPLALNGGFIQAISWTGSQSTALGSTTVNQTAWNQGYTTWNAANGLSVYLNGIQDENTAQATYSASGGSNYLHVAGDVAGGAGDEGHFDGQVDELRVHDDLIATEWIYAEYRNIASSTDFYSTSSEALTPTTYTELDFWRKHFSTSTDEADIWVQVDTIPAQGSTTIYMYYGNTSATDASDEWAPFTYSTTSAEYYVVQNDQVDGAIDVYSLIDDNDIVLDGAYQTTLDEGETISLTGFASSSAVHTTGPISVTINDNNVDTLAPISFATTTFVHPNDRNVNVHYFLSPFSTTTLNIFEGNGGTATATLSMGTSSTASATVDTGGTGVVVESTAPILYYHVELTRDSVVQYPPTSEDLYGIHTGGTLQGALAANPDPTIYCSDGTSFGTGVNIDRGDEQVLGNGICTELGQGQGPALRYTGAGSDIAVLQQADDDGSETTSYWPELEFNTKYYMPGDSAYLAVACSPRFGTTTLEVRTNSDVLIESGTCTPTNTNFPGKAYFNNGLDGSQLAFAAGSYIISTNEVPFYVIYEDDEEDNDETNMLGAAQARKWTEYPIGVTFGAQEASVDAEYTQNSFRWFENEDAEPPTSHWPIDDEGGLADEGVSIPASGAVNASDVLRLRMNLLANNATGTASSTAFKLQYSEATSCSLSTNEWFDLGAIGSTTAAFSGYDNASISDGATVSSTTLASSTVFATYEEENLSTAIPSDIEPDEYGEWDWVIQNTNANVNSNYCFRMVRASGVELFSYATYPQLETAGPPLAPTLLVYFDNEHTPDLTPVLEFTTTDLAADDIHYQVQVDDDYAFGSIDIDRNSEDNSTEFSNLNTPSDKSPFDNGAQIRFTSPTTIASSTTFYWRVRGRDPAGSNTYGDWSSIYSFTTNQNITISEWFQTTDEQFNTNALDGLATTSGTDQIEVIVGSTTGTMIGTAIDFDDATVGNAWGDLSWNDTPSTGTTTYQVQFYNGSAWGLIPDTDLPGNSTGATTSPVSLNDLNTTTYNQIRPMVTVEGTTPTIQDWTVSWSLRVDTATLQDPFNHEKIPTTTPTMQFFTTDPQGDDLEYEISWSTDNTFVTGSTTVNSQSSPTNWSNVTTPADTDPFNSGDIIAYELTAGQALTNGETYWWRVRARDPGGGNSFAPWSTPFALTVDTAVTVSTWFQTTQEQFEDGTLSGVIASTSDAVTITTQVGEYGTTTVTNGVWTQVDTVLSYVNPTVVTSVRYSSSTDVQRTSRVDNKQANSFDVLADNYDGSVTGTTVVDWMVMEAGDWTIEDGGTGARAVAGTLQSVDVVESNALPDTLLSPTVTFDPVFTQTPAIITSVSTANDTSWVFSSTHDGFDSDNLHSGTTFGAFLNRNFEPATHEAEDIDWIAFEQVDGTNNGVQFESIVTAQVIDELPDAISFTTAFSTAPQVTLVQAASQSGANGGYVYVDTDNPVTVNDITPLFDEDGTNADRIHANEYGSIIVFEDPDGTILRASTTLTGTIAGNAIPFSDGNGPKFERFFFTETSPGNSTTSIQVQYLTGTSTWTLIPDSAIPGNSVGTTTGPVDLTNVDVSTYSTIRLLASLECDGAASCPSLEDWTVEWSEGVDLSGTAQEYDRSTNVTSGTVNVAVNGVLQGSTGTISGGTWTINNVTAFADDTITVFIQGAADANEAVNVFVYDGVGDMTNIELYERHLTFSSDEIATTSNALIAPYDFSASGDEDLFFDVDDTTGDLNVCAEGDCISNNIYIGSANIFAPATTTNEIVYVHDIVNDGTIQLNANTLEINGSWENNGTSTPGTASLIFSATSTLETLDDTSDNLLAFENITFGTSSGAATWTIQDPLDLTGNLTVDFGTLLRDAEDINLEGDLSIGASGVWDGTASTTFDGSSSANWTDNSSPSQDIGYVYVDGAAKTVIVQSDVRGTSLEIGADDTLSGGGANTIAVGGDFINNNTFTPSSSTVDIIATSTSVTVTIGGSSFNNLTFSGVDGISSFTDSSITVLNDFTIATGTVTLPTATTTVGGSFVNTDGTFAHNNGEVEFTSTGPETVTLNGNTFLNSLYDATFSGSGSWTISDTNATTSRNFLIENGAVTFPSGSLTVGEDLIVSGSGSFAHNSGEVILLVQSADDITTNGSTLNNVRVRANSLGGWYDTSWRNRVQITVDSGLINEDLTDFPIYVDLADFGASFFADLKNDGGDIRVTESDGVTEVAREIVVASTTALTGEIHFLAPSLSSTTDSTFYLYYNNESATDYATTTTFGAQNVWNNDFDAVFHMEEDPGGSAPQMLNSTRANHPGTVTAMDSGNQVAGQIENAVDHDGSAEDISSPGYSDLGTTNQPYSMSAWFNADTGETDGNILHISQLAGGTGWCVSMLVLNSDNLQANSWDGGAVGAQGTTSITQGQWHYGHGTWNATDGLSVYLDGGLDQNTTQGVFSASGASNYLRTGFSPGSCSGNEGYFNGQIDEVRISTSSRSTGWIYAEFRNQATTTDFYSSSLESVFARTFTDTNVTALGDMVIESGEATFPSGTYTIGGSFDNDSVFNANDGVVLFNSSSGSETIAAGSSTFATVEFNNGAGDFTVTESATATTAWTLTDADTFIVSSGVFVEVNGPFMTSIGGASTTWDGSTLYLNSSSTYAINASTTEADAYGTFAVSSTTDISMWNSTSTLYSIETGGSLYSQDHNNADGDLYIFGEYERTGGADYWSYGTDFDGTDLTAGSNERGVSVYFADNSTSTFTGNATLEILGDVGASTTITNQGSGEYAVLLGATSTINAQYYSFANLDWDGLTLTGSTTITSLQDGEFELTLDGGSTISFGAEVIDSNPTLQIQRVSFSTTTAITGANVTATGTPASYFWFRNHYGNLAGEDFDIDPGGNPGNVRWDDSGFTITVSGTVYDNERSGGIGNPPCDGSTTNVRVRVNGGGNHTGFCDAGTGAYTVAGVTFSGTPILTVYLDTGGGARAVTVTKTPTGDITDLDLYENHVIIRHEDTETMSITDLDIYDSGNDSDIPYLATLGGTDTLVVEPNTALYVWDGKTFFPDGDVTLDSGGTLERQDGSLYVASSSSFIATSTESHSVGGELVLDLSATLTSASSTFTFTATTTGKTIAATSTLNEVVFNGVGGGWNIASSTTILEDITMTAGTATGTGDVMVQGGDITGDGVFAMTGGTVTLEGTGSFGGASNWIFNNLTFGDGTTIATTTKAGSGSVESSGILTIDTNHILDANSSNWELSGGGTVFVVNGTFDADTSLFTYSGTGAANITAETYNRLTAAATGGSPTYTMLSGTLSVLDAFTVGDGTNAVTVTANTNDPTLTVGGDITINQNGTFVGSNSGTFEAGASWLNSGTYTHSNGTVLFNATTTGHSITASTSPFFTATLDSTVGGWTVTDNATSSNNFNLTNADTFVVAPGATLSVGGQFSNEVGGASTTWSGSTLYLNSGTNYTVNGTSTLDTYNTLLIGDDTDVRIWNSSAGTTTVATSSSLYSQDHSNVDGDLYIWGDYVNSLGNDYWSFAIDFDGRDLAILSEERQANVRFADNATSTLSGVSLEIVGTTSASTTIAAQGSGTYAFEVTGGTFTAEYYTVQDINVDGINISGTPTINELGNGDFLIEIDSGTGITVAGATIDANTGMTFSNNIFATSSPIGGVNVTATGASTGSWRFTGYTGNLGGEAFDVDPGGDPGYLIWDDSDSQITVSGTVFTDDGVTTAGAPTCNGSNQSVQLRVAGAGSLSSSCDGSGNYSITGVVPSPGDVITVYLDADNGATFAGATVTVDPLTNITNMDIYQDRVIVRHEDTNAITNANLAVCDSSVAGCDTDIPFDVTGNDLVTDAGTELYVWDSKSYSPNGNITLHGNGGGEPDGSLHVDENASFIGSSTDAYSIAGSFNMMEGAMFTAASSTVTMTATTTGKIISATSSPFYDLTFSGSGGAWSFPPNEVEAVNDFTITAGTVTLGSATTTVGGSFDNTGGSFVHNNGLVLLTASTTGQTIEAGGSNFFDLTLNGIGGEWTFQDSNATTTNDFTITVGSTTLPTGVYSIGGSFENTAGIFNAPSGTQYFNSTGVETIFANGSDFAGMQFDGSGGDWTFIDEFATSSGDFEILDGTVTLATGTLAIAESFDNSGGAFTAGATNTVRLYGAGGSETINPNGSNFTNLVIDGGSGTWTLSGNATTTENFDLLNATGFTAAGYIKIEGQFQNLVGGGATTWTGSTLDIDSDANYSINDSSAGGDSYETLIVGTSASSTDIRMWNSTSTIYTTNGTSSIYSQDHNSSDGELYIFGQYELSSGTDNWSYATDFDGAALSAPNRRAVSVFIDQNATTTYSGGSLNIIGVDGSTTTVSNQGTGQYGIQMTEGTLNAQFYRFEQMNGLGLNLSGSTTVVTSLSNGDFQLAVNDGATLRVSSTTIDNNPTLVIDNTDFNRAPSVSTGFNASRDSASVNAWTFNTHSGDIAGETFDDDGADACGSFRWDDSSCLFVSQEHFRWRNDDGGEGVPNSLWYDTDWDYRQKVAIGDTAATSATNLAVEILVPYDSDMQADFEDLRFTDSTGTNTIDYWIESFTASTDATVWVEVPTITSNSTSTIYMYYGNSGAEDNGFGTTTFPTFDDFEDNDITEYSGDFSPDLFDALATMDYEGLYGLGAASTQEGSQTTDGIYQFAGAGTTVEQGQTIRYFQYVDMSTGGDDESCTLFAVQNPTNSNNYAVCFDPFNADEIIISENVTSNDTSGTVLATTSVTFTTGWYEVEIDWQTDNSIFVSVYDDGTLFATTTATDSSYTSGGFGFSFWGQHGGWDAFSVRDYVSSDPAYIFGLEQGNGGATWKAAEDTAITEQEVGDTQRLRLLVSNTGADLTDQEFRLQYAAKGASLSCESVSGASYTDVPTDTAGCGTDHVCMATSTNLTNLASTTEHLSGPDTSIFVDGQFMEDPSNESAELDVATNEFIELEYIFEMTSFVTDDAYCFRTTDAGSAYDDYSRVAELQLKFAPIISNFTLNSAQDIVLIPGGTTTIYATGTAIDLNGYADLDYATTSIYRSGVAGGTDCAEDDNNCYQLASTSCAFSFCSGNSCELTCTADFLYHADPTDSGAYSAEEWLAEMTIVDSTAESDTGLTLGVELLTLRAISASSTIPYGSLGILADTGDYNATTTIQNDGNDNIDVDVSGTDLTFGASSIGVANQLYSTTTFNYGGCGVLCTALSGSPTQVEVDLGKPTASTTVVNDEIYWGIFIPLGTAAAAHEGQNTFEAVAD